MEADLSTPEMRAAHWLSWHGLDLSLTEALAMRFKMEAGVDRKLDTAAADAAVRHYSGLLVEMAGRGRI